MIEPGMKPGKTVPEDYGMKSYVLQSIDAVARKGLEAGAYPGCRVLVWKDGLPVYDKGFGTHSDKDTTTEMCIRDRHLRRRNGTYFN